MKQKPSSIISPFLFSSSASRSTLFFMPPLFLSTPRLQITPYRPLFLSAMAWTAMLLLTVTVASFAPEVAFLNAVSPSSPFSSLCYAEGFVRIPLDFPGDVVCLPAPLVMRSKLDFCIPTIFLALTVASSAFLVRFFVFLDVQLPDDENYEDMR